MSTQTLPLIFIITLSYFQAHCLEQFIPSAIGQVIPIWDNCHWIMTRLIATMRFSGAFHSGRRHAGSGGSYVRVSACILPIKRP